MKQSALLALCFFSFTLVFGGNGVYSQDLLQGNFNGVQHTGIPVSNIETSREFYTKLGFEDVMKTTTGSGARTIYVSMMKRGNAIIELYQLPERSLEEIRSRKDGHIDHVAFDIDDADKAFEELKNAGFKPVQPAPVKLDFWDNGCKYFTIRGPDGEVLEFNEIM